MLRAVGRGALARLAWGLLARLFMRLLAATPEFTWSGTLAILGLSTLLGTGWDCRGCSSDRPLPVVAPGPGSRPRPVHESRHGDGAGSLLWHLAVRSRVATLLLLVAGLAAVVVPAVLLDDAEGAEASPLASLGLALMVVAVGLLGVGFHEWWRRWAPAAPPTPARALSETRV